ncbi:uncharacterized protein [Palaemon carinicauda]|uniref:uncharacterized protein n=1 Tax=Palaemon carinicauda TaxID=392227 RepID=UPI0035B64B78
MADIVSANSMTSHSCDIEVQDPNPGLLGFWPSEDDVFRYAEPEEGAEDDYTQVVYDVKPFEGTVDVDFNVNPDNAPELVNESVTNAIFKDLEHRIAEDVHRMQQDMLLFRRLFRRDPVVPQMPSLFIPWGIAASDDDDESQGTFGPAGFDFNPFGRGGEDDGDDDSDEEDDDFHGDELFGGFPFIGMDRPLFSNLPELPGVGFVNPADLPGNYSNETSVVHDVDGGEIQVNSTVNKASGNNFNTFFHHQVIHFRPDEEEGVPTSAPEATEAPEVPATEVPATEVPVTEEQDVNKGVTSAPEVEEEKEDAPASPQPPALPEVSPEVSSANAHSESNALPKEDFLTDEEDFEIANNLLAVDGMRKNARSLRVFKPINFPNDKPLQNDFPHSEEYVHKYEEKDDFPQSEKYSYHKDQEEEEDNYDDAEVVTDGSSSRRRPVDLSKDTRVNYIQTGEGMAKPDPDAEIFNYGLVLEEERASRRGQ